MDGRPEEDVELDFQPFSKQILSEPIPRNYVFLKIGLFTRKQEPNAHIKNLRAQILICGGSDAVRCKTLVGTTLDWFINLPRGSITSLEIFTKLFVAHLRQTRRSL